MNQFSQAVVEEALSLLLRFDRELGPINQIGLVYVTAPQTIFDGQTVPILTKTGFGLPGYNKQCDIDLTDEFSNWLSKFDVTIPTDEDFEKAKDPNVTGADFQYYTRIPGILFVKCYQYTYLETPFSMAYQNLIYPCGYPYLMGDEVIKRDMRIKDVEPCVYDKQGGLTLYGYESKFFKDIFWTTQLPNQLVYTFYPYLIHRKTRKKILPVARDLKLNIVRLNWNNIVDYLTSFFNFENQAASKQVAKYQNLVLFENGLLFEEGKEKGKVDVSRKAYQSRFNFLKLLMQNQSKNENESMQTTETELIGICGKKDFESMYSKINQENLKETSYEIAHRSGTAGYYLRKKTI